MEIMKLCGYTTPEDFPGSPADRIQKALDAAEAEDIRKVVLRHSYTVDRTLFIPGQTEILFEEGASLTMTGEGPLFQNRIAKEEGRNSWSFEDSRIYIRHEHGTAPESPVITGDFSFYHASYVVLEDLKIRGTVSFEFCREVRMERDEFFGKEQGIVLGRGCNNFILQRLKAGAEKTAVVLDTRIEKGPYVIGKDAEIHEIILRDSDLDAETAVFLGASAEYGIFNAQIDHLKASGNGVAIGDGSGLDAKRFFNLTVTDIAAGKAERVLNNAVKHCYFGAEEN